MSFPWAKQYEPTNGVMQWLDQRLPLPRLVYNAVGAGYPVPRNLNYAYAFGGILAINTAHELIHKDARLERMAGGLLLGTDKRSAAEFSFFLAIPTMVGAFGLDFWQSRDMITGDVASLIAIGPLVRTAHQSSTPSSTKFGLAEFPG